MHSAQLPDELIDALRARLLDMAYTEERLLEVLDRASVFSAGAQQQDVTEKLAATGPLGALAGLLWFGRLTPLDEVRVALGGELLDALIAAEVLLLREGQVRSAIIALPWSGHVLLSDRPGSWGSDDGEHVMSVGRGTDLLAKLMIRRPVEHALDLGTGCGPLALEATRFAERVDAIDLNERALDYARVNLRLNEAGGCNVQRGDFFALDQVLGEQRYDLIVSQPPFFLGPSKGAIFRDAMGHGDSGLWRVVEVTAQWLRPGGYGQVLMNWFQLRGQDPDERNKQLLAKLDCDIFVGQSQREDPLVYARHWMASLGMTAEEQQTELPRYAQYYQELGVETVCSGIVVLRKCAGGQPGWRQMSELAEDVTAGAGAHLLQMFAALDRLQTTSDEQLEAMRLCVSSDLRVEQALTPTATGWRTQQCSTQRTAGILYQLNHDAVALDLVMACNGRNTLAQIIEQLVERKHGPPANLRPFVLSTARMMLSHGLLLPAPDAE